MEASELYNLKDEDRPALSNQIIVEAVNEYLQIQRSQFQQMNVKKAKDLLISEINYKERSQLKSCRSYEMTIRAGDICFIDYGKAYQLEAGYQHFGLVINIFYAKAFVIPMTSNYEVYKQAYHPVYNPEGMRNLMRIGRADGLNRYSVLYLNDAKFINTARIIDIKGHISVDDPLFYEASYRLIECIKQQQ